LLLKPTASRRDARRGLYDAAASGGL